MIGEDGYVNAGCGFDDSIDALLGTNNFAKVKNAYEWLSGNKPYLWRVNIQPDKDTERVVVLGIDVGRFDISSYAGISSSRPARGWSVNKSSGN